MSNNSHQNTKYKIKHLNYKLPETKKKKEKIYIYIIYDFTLEVTKMKDKKAEYQEFTSSFIRLTQQFKFPQEYRRPPRGSILQEQTWTSLPYRRNLHVDELRLASF